MAQTVADVLSLVGMYDLVVTDLTTRGLMTPGIQTAIVAAQVALKNEVAAAIKAVTPTDAPFPDVVKDSLGNYYSFDVNSSGVLELDQVTVLDAASVPV